MTDKTSLYRRELLKKFAVAGLAHSCGMLGVVQQALAENLLDIKQGVISVTGKVFVGGQLARKGSLVKPGQSVLTEKGAEAIYVIGSNAFIQRESSSVHIGADTLVDFMHVASGRILSVFGAGNKNIRLANATIGIRGTALHLSVEPEQTYFCLCYGEAELKFAEVEQTPIQMKSSHHDKPIYIPSHGKATTLPAKMLDHQDDELKLLEALVGRLPPFIKG